ncbi:MAG TPA: hypothetical protein VNI54_10510 [Thermoanaerobaculia bacterium]|nr:hypothetical protein [Thermoanaerobaculia bacterium]
MNRISWLTASAIPVIAVLISRLFPASSTESAALPALAFGAMIVFVATAQRYVVSHRRFALRWFLTTVAGLIAALVSAAIVLGVADVGGSERAGIAVAHAVAGCLLVLLQASAARAMALNARRWVSFGAAASVIVSIALAAASSLGWHPGGDVARFAGFRELANFAVLLAGYGVGTAFSISASDVHFASDE